MKLHSSFALRIADGTLKSFPKPSVMGVINMSPDSFFNPSPNISAALFLVEKMISAGAVFIDIGGEATNLSIDLTKGPNVQQEMERVIPLIEAVRKRFDVLISVDTSRPQIMSEAVRAGANMINDQRALQTPQALITLVALKVPVCLMHFFNPPRKPGSCDLPTLFFTIKNDLSRLVEQCLMAGISQDRIILDMGFGQGNYGKNCAENFYLLTRINELATLGYPVLLGWSRKSMIGDVLGGVPANQRLFGSIAAATMGAMLGAAIIRVHDVAETVDAVKVFNKYYEHIAT